MESTSQPKINRPTNELNVTSHGQLDAFLKYGLKVLENENEPYLKIVGEGKTTGRAVTVCELIKTKSLVKLHQYNQLLTTESKESANPSKTKTPKLELILSTKPQPELAHLTF